MPGFETIATTTRVGLVIDEVEVELTGAAPVTAYMLGRRPDQVQPVAIGLHHDRGDKSTMLADLEHLAARGFFCVSIDSPAARQALAVRDHAAAFELQYLAAETTLNLLQGDPDILDHRVGIVGRGIGGEVGAHLAANTARVQAVVAYNPMLRRSHFLATSDHPLASGLRGAVGHELDAMISTLAPRDLARQFEVSNETHWMLQVGDDDDRLSDDDWEHLTMRMPHAVRLRRHRSMADVIANPGRRERVDFLSELCG